ncbi:TPA: hypothetical protein EYN23_14850 [Candidatus Poribacteria bacterium]|nr:hypothetical protein [Candidatus Poribacteria bacterium]
MVDRNKDLKSQIENICKREGYETSIQKIILELATESLTRSTQIPDAELKSLLQRLGLKLRNTVE